MADKGIRTYSVSEWEKMEQRIITLQKWIDKFGGHTAECASHNWKRLSLMCPEHEDCDCGWDKITKSLQLF